MKREESKEAVVPAQAEVMAPPTGGISDIENLVQLAIKQGDTATLEQVMNMRRELRAEQIKAAYHAAMAEFQNECPAIVKKKPIPDKLGNVKFRTAPLEDIVKQVRELVRSKGFSYSFKTESYEKGIKVTCKVDHRDGHSEEHSVPIPGVKIPSANEAQNAGGTITYGKRLSFCNAFGIMTADTDTDGVDPVVATGPTISSHQEAEILALASEIEGYKTGLLLDWVSKRAGREIPNISDIPAELYPDVVRALEDRRKRGAS